MFPLPFSISPLLLSILVLYPWALALGVWQVGKLATRSSNPSSVVREADQRLDDGTFFSSPHGWSLTDQVGAALPPVRLTDLPDVVVVAPSFPSFPGAAYASPSIAHRIPRAPPASS